MAQPKKQHPAIIAAEAEMITAIRGADHFLASLFIGVGEYEKVARGTVLAAVQAGKQLAEARRSTRQAIIYAVGADGRATMLTAALIERLGQMARASA